MYRAVSFWYFVAVVVLAPLPYGSAHLWSSAMLALLTAGALALWSAGAILRADFHAVPAPRYILPLILFAGVLGWVLLQSASFTPADWHHPLWSQTAAALDGQTVRGAISLDPDGTMLAAVRMTVYAIVFWLAMQYARSGRYANAMLWAICIAGFLYATYGIWAHLSGSQQILFTDKWAYRNSLTSTFVNRNHYAVYAGMGMVAAFALLVGQLKKDASGAFDSSRRFLNSVENLKLPAFVLTAIFIVIGSALLLTQSRGGVAFTGLALTAFVLMMNISGNLRKRSSLGLLGGLLAGGIVLFAVSGDDFSGRIIGKLWESERGAIHAVALDAIADAPLAGHGVGTFPSLFHIYRGEGFAPLSPAFAAAHNVYLEFAAGAGVIAALAYFGLQLLIAGRCFAGTLQRRRNQLYPALGCATAVLIGFHSYYDFGPQIPGVAVTYAALLGLAYAQSWPSDRRRREEGQSGDR